MSDLTARLAARRRLEELVKQWRERARKNTTVVSETEIDDTAVLFMAAAQRQCADELDALLAAGAAGRDKDVEMTESCDRPHVQRKRSTQTLTITSDGGQVSLTDERALRIAHDILDLLPSDEVGAAGRAVQPQVHQDCHDLVCNGSREYPRGATGVGCSCRGRDERALAAAGRDVPREPPFAELLADLRKLDSLYNRDRIASQMARQIERIFDKWLREDSPAAPLARSERTPRQVEDEKNG